MNTIIQFNQIIINFFNNCAVCQLEYGISVLADSEESIFLMVMFLPEWNENFSLKHLQIFHDILLSQLLR